MRTAILLLALILLPGVSGKDLSSGQELRVAGKKGTLLAFLSARCPCSGNHLQPLKTLAAEHPGVAFVGVHSNADEPSAEAKKYFEKAALPFPVIQDEGAKLADEYGAQKTPHVFLLSAEGKVLYRGGVTGSNSAASDSEQYLGDALADLEAGREIRRPHGRTLGCVIAR